MEKENKTKNTGRSYLSLIGGAIALLAFFAPWAGCNRGRDFWGSAGPPPNMRGPSELSGADLAADKPEFYIALVAALIIVVVFLIFLFRKQLGLSRWLIIISAVGGIVFLIAEYINLQNQEIAELVTLRWGAFVTLLGFLLALIGAPFVKSIKSKEIIASAIIIVAACIISSCSSPTNYEIAEAFYNNKEYSKAIELLEQEIQANTDSTKNYILYGKCYLDQYNFAGAAIAFGWVKQQDSKKVLNAYLPILKDLIAKDSLLYLLNNYKKIESLINWTIKGDLIDTLRLYNYSNLINKISNVNGQFSENEKFLISSAIIFDDSISDGSYSPNIGRYSKKIVSHVLSKITSDEELFSTSKMLVELLPDQYDLIISKVQNLRKNKNVIQGKFIDYPGKIPWEDGFACSLWIYPEDITSENNQELFGLAAFRPIISYSLKFSTDEIISSRSLNYASNFVKGYWSRDNHYFNRSTIPEFEPKFIEFSKLDKYEFAAMEDSIFNAIVAARNEYIVPELKYYSTLFEIEGKAIVFEDEYKLDEKILYIHIFIGGSTKAWPVGINVATVKVPCSLSNAKEFFTRKKRLGIIHYLIYPRRDREYLRYNRTFSSDKTVSFHKSIAADDPIIYFISQTDTLKIKTKDIKGNLIKQNRGQEWSNYEKANNRFVDGEIIL